MARICILSVSNIRHMSLIKLYTHELEARKVPYDIIYMDKYGEIEQIEAENIYRFENIINKNSPKLLRALKYLRFIGYAKRVLNENDYHFVITWGEITALLFSNYLSKHYSGRYCINIRDYFFQDRYPISKCFSRCMEKARFTTVSSDKYRKFLPKLSNIITVHSLNEEILSDFIVRKHQCEGPIKIGFIGYVRFYEINRALIDVFGNDMRFELHYYGSHSEVLEEYARSKDISNCVFLGGFSVEDTAQFVNRIDVLNNLYGSGTSHVDYALSIRLYYAIYANLPILVNSGTYMEEVSRKLGIGFVVEQIDEDLPDRFYKWYTNLDYTNLIKYCQAALEGIREDQSHFLEAVDDLICSFTTSDGDGDAS